MSTKLKKKAVEMMNIKNCLALGVAMGFAVIANFALAQDDLDALLQDLEGTTAKAVSEAQAPAKAEPVEAAVPEEPAKEESAAEESAAEEPAAEESAKEEPAKEEEVAKEETSVKEDVTSAQEEASAEEEKPAEVATVKEEVPAEEEASEEEEKPAEVAKKVDEVMSLLDELAAENSDLPTAMQVSAADDQARAAKAAAPVAAVQSKPQTSNLKPQTPNVSSPDAELLANVRATEKLRREALDLQAKREISEARRAMSSEEYDEAVRHYGLALKLLNDRQSSKNLRKECDQGMAEGLYRAALQEDDLGRRDRAVKLMEKAIDMRHPKARRVLEKWNLEGNSMSDRTGLADIKHRLNDEDYKKSRKQIRQHLKRSLQYLAVKDMDKALEECEIVLVNDPYNQEAIRIRKAIESKRKLILQQEGVAAHDGMIADVDEKWRPVYAVKAAQLKDTSSETVKTQTGEDPERTMEQEIEQRMKAMRLPTISFKPPATIIDAVEFFRGASKDFDRPDIPIEKRGFNFVLKTPTGAIKQQVASEDQADDFSSNDNAEESATANGLPPIPTITASDITFYEALKLVCDSVDYKFIVRGPVVMVMQKDMSTAELLSRKYNVPEAFIERVNTASDEVKQLRQAGGFGGSSRKTEDEGENQERDWKAFFEQMGVKWPEGSSITHVKALGKLYVRNTRENLAEFEKLLDELGATPPLIEIETRFVEVSQEDLNSLGFEWILNSDYSLDVGRKLGKALGIKRSEWGKENGLKTWTGSDGWSDSTVENNDYTIGSNGKKLPGPNSGTTYTGGKNGSSSYSYTHSLETYPHGSTGANLVRTATGARTVGVNAFGGTDSAYNRSNRYLSDTGNFISGADSANNDQFMRVNAFLGNADLSMILHMLSQRSDTDLLSAPKVVTKSGENAVIKVVTEYIYPQDYDVQLQSSGSSGGSNYSSGNSSSPMAIVEPQNFTMREVGVILDVTPTYSEANGGTIDLELKPQVVDEPIWHNYGMKLPFQGSASSGSIAAVPDLAGIIDSMVSGLTSLGVPLSDEDKTSIGGRMVNTSMNAIDSLSNQKDQEMTWYDAPMEQPFFHVRSIDSKVSITPGSTVVMGGLITEQRKAMDDKIPFLGDLPFVGRLFRSHAEQTIKRNLLIFVTGRLITPSGRELTLNEETTESTSEVKSAPKAE